jgi:hypothetical protein
MPHFKQFAFGTLALTLLPLWGCEQGLGGGAYTESSVKLIVSDTSGGSAPLVEGNGGGTAATASDGQGTIKGRVVIEGTAPALAMLLEKGAVTKDAICAVNGVPNESVIADASGGLSNVFVYLKKAPKGTVLPALPPVVVSFDQKGCIFVPHAFVARVGQTINLKNSDTVAHNVHTFSKGNPLNSAMKGEDIVGTNLVYAEAESLPIRTICDFHAWMDSYHLVVDHPWATVTGPDGSFEIKDVPSGKMEFIVWHEKVGYVNRSLKVDVLKDQTTEVPVIQVPAAKLATK